MENTYDNNNKKVTHNTFTYDLRTYSHKNEAKNEKDLI